ncbi:hypothetical protein ACFYW9_40260, partial [Streptomyces sp. NPDC002698]|uniref:hypothetical protein n=1 Tax=Streptomyces sp. NPDC002698 TaxID=3364660 RepID=UPI0036B6BB5B
MGGGPVAVVEVGGKALQDGVGQGHEAALSMGVPVLRVLLGSAPAFSTARRVFEHLARLLL